MRLNMSAAPWRQLALQRRCFSASSCRRDNYAFIGLGQMGSHMARNLQAKLAPDDTLSLFDINAESVQTLAAAMQASSAQSGAAVAMAPSAAEACRDADIVLTALPEPSHVRSVYASILTAAFTPRPAPRIFIDCSTIDPTTSRDVAATVAAATAAHFVDAPMSGGIVGAAAGTLTFMLGSPRPLVPRIEPVLRHMGASVLHCGAQGAGLSAKLANNYLLAITNIATAEAMNLGMRWGLDRRVLAGVLNASTGRCWPSEVNNPVPGVVARAPAARDYQGGFGLALMRKDLGLAMVAAEQAGARLPLAHTASEVYAGAARDQRCQGRDFSVVYRYLGGEE